MNVLVIDCLTAGKGKRFFSRDFIGGGPRLIAGILKKSELDFEKIQIIRAESLLKKRNIDINIYDLCLVSAMTMDFKVVEEILSIWRKKRKEGLIIIGGPITSDPSLLTQLSFDFCVTGEGETKLLEILKTIKDNIYRIDEKIVEALKKIKGISFRYNEVIYTTGIAKILNREEFNKLSYPEMMVKFVKHYDNFKTARIYVECLRGCSNYHRIGLSINEQLCNSCNDCTKGVLIDRIKCPQNIPPGCGFCSTIDTFGFPKSRGISLILSEIQGLLDIGVKRIVLGGADFFDYKREALVKDLILTTPNPLPEPNYEALNQLISEITELKQIKERNTQIFIENIKASLCTDEALGIISRIPNSIFSIGCETGSEEFSRILGRPCGPSETLDAITRAIHKFGIRVHVYFIHSLLAEKPEYLQESIELIKKFYDIGVEKITIYKYQQFPGTPFALIKNFHQLLYQNDKKLNKLRKKLVNAAIQFNRERKREMIGRIYQVLIAEESVYNDNDAIGYILIGGPKVLIKNGINDIGKECKVKIEGLISDKMIIGSILGNKNCY